MSAINECPAMMEKGTTNKFLSLMTLSAELQVGYDFWINPKYCFSEMKLHTGTKRMRNQEGEYG